MKKIRMAFFALATFALLTTSTGCGGGGGDSDDDDTPVAESGSTGGSGSESGASAGSGNESTGGSSTGSGSSESGSGNTSSGSGSGNESTGGSSTGSGSSESGSGNTSSASGSENENTGGSGTGSGSSESGSGNTSSASGSGNESTGVSGTGDSSSESGSGSTSADPSSGSGASENGNAGSGSGIDGFVLVQGTTVNGITDITDLWVCDHEVTQGEYELYCSYGADTPSNTYGKESSYPVYYVSWYDALVYCNNRSIAEGLTPCYKIDGRTDSWGTVPTSDNEKWNGVSCDFNANGYRLPTTKEWRYIARSGNTSNSGSDNIEAVAWYKGNSESKTHKVKTKSANDLGLYDMIGNVCEWCWDFHMVPLTVSTNNGYSWKQKYFRYQYYCGGSWRSSAANCSVSCDNSSLPASRDSDLGFRVVRSNSK